MTGSAFIDFFRTAVGEDRFPFQERFARDLHPLVSVPTGLGKTAMVVIGWLWRRRGAPSETRASTPRRLVYCLPMRVLVEQTRENAVIWLRNLDLTDRVAVHVLMGGEDKDDWDTDPERDALLIGTQDMLLSRALNRGYAASRARWPMQFGLLNTDCLWVFDEVQLMGSGLASTAQLEALRWMLGPKNGHSCRSVWMSATLRPDWLQTVDFKDRVGTLACLELGADDHAVWEVGRRWRAKKPLTRVAHHIGDINGIAAEIGKAHRPGRRTIVVVNTVRRARQLYDASGKQQREGTADATGRTPTLVLLHSRFRPGDRTKAIDRAIGPIDPAGAGTIVISTQVIEAGVDVSATTLFTELAPWPSLIQRFGRCDRRGNETGARVFWIDLPEAADGDKDGKTSGGKSAGPHEPYELSQLVEARALLEKCTKGVGLASLQEVERANAELFSKAMTFEHTHVLRAKDLTDLFDTTPDLAGRDIDVDRFVREVEDSDVRVFWRMWNQDVSRDPPADEPAPTRDELCPAPIGEFREFARQHRHTVWRWNFLDKKWGPADPQGIAPGQVLLVHGSAGGYSATEGWDPASDEPVAALAPDAKDGAAPDSIDDDPPSRLGVWQTIGEHGADVCREMETILAELPALSIREADALRAASRWHDRGKAHAVFQNAIDDGQRVVRRDLQIQRRERPAGWRGSRMVAKAPDTVKQNGRVVDRGWWRPYDWPAGGRKHFRHELASAIAVLDPRNAEILDDLRDLVAYLVAAHHGKVRLSIRSLPGERVPEPAANRGHRRFARGVWDGDELPETDLGDDVIAPAMALSLELMEIGLCEDEPFNGEPSWADRMIRLRDTLGPFRLAYLEAVLRAADMRSSQAAERRAVSSPVAAVQERNVDG